MKNLDKYNLIIINFLFFLFPLSIILGNFFTNLNLLLLSFAAFFFYKKKIIEFKINIFDKIILIFFIYTFITLIINLLENYLSQDILRAYHLQKKNWQSCSSISNSTCCKDYAHTVVAKYL